MTDVTKPTSLIKSNRTFGVELELGCLDDNGISKLRRDVSRKFAFERDGSIEAMNPIEIVSPVLKGAEGEEMVRDLCTKLKKYQFFGDDPSCGFHAHLGGEGFYAGNNLEVVEDVAAFKKQLGEGAIIHSLTFVQNSYIRLQYHLKTKATNEDYIRVYHDTRYIAQGAFNSLVKRERGIKYLACAMHKEEFLSNGDVTVAGVIKISDLEKTIAEYYRKRDLAESMASNTYVSTNELQSEFKANTNSLLGEGKGGKWIVEYTTGKEFQNLKTLFHFYVSYDDVMLAMLPDHRKDGNVYCRALTESYTAEAILKLQNQDELESYWYKTPKENVQGRKRERRDQSRRHGINLHALFQRYKTLEVRFHAGETDADKILYWVALHQHIMDKVVDGTIVIGRTEVSKGFALEDKVAYMLDEIEAPKHIREYVNRLVNYYKK